MKDIFNVGDSIVLVSKSASSNPPEGTTGTILKLYNAFGGPAAQIKWDDIPEGNEVFSNRVLLKDIKTNEAEIEESDTNMSVLFGGFETWHQ